MGKEIERKFLVVNDSFIGLSKDKVEIIQGYLSTVPERTVRLRIAGRKAFLTVKTRNEGPVRNEWEFEITESEAREMLEHAAVGILSKTRYFVEAADGNVWEVDCFHGDLEGLCIAEIELKTAGAQFAIPDFVGAEVTGDPRYYNSNLCAGV